MATPCEYSLELGARVMEAAVHCFQGEAYEAAFDQVHSACNSPTRNPHDILDYLAIARGCFAGGSVLLDTGNDLGGLYHAFGLDIVRNAMEAFCELPESVAVMHELCDEVGHEVHGIRWVRRAWLVDLTADMVSRVGETQPLQENLAGMFDIGTRTYRNLAEQLMCIRVCHGAAEYWREQGQSDIAQTYFSAAQHLVDRASETYGWLLVDAVADIPKH